MTPSLSDAQLLLEIVDVAFPEGYGVAKRDDFVLFVPGGLPGDIVRAKITREGKRFGFAQLLDFERESPFRRAATCPHFGVCGGCVFQNLAYEKQLELKQNYLLQTLQRLKNLKRQKRSCMIYILTTSNI